MKTNKFVVIVLALFLMRVIFSFLTWHPDLNNHIDWGIRLYQYGPDKFYSPESNVWSFTWPNQPPGSIYIFAVIRKVFEMVFSGLWLLNINISLFPSIIVTLSEHLLYPALLKLPAIVSDFGIAYIIFKVLKEAKSEKAAKLGAVIYLVNPVIWYNSSLWGQTDSIINFFALLSVYLLIKRKLILAILFLTLSLYIKVSLLIFVPIIIILAIQQKYLLKTWIQGILLSLAVFGILTIPFSKGNPYPFLLHIYKDKVFVQQMQVITANAFNIWAVTTGIHEIPQSTKLGPITYQSWGLILFLFAYVPALLVVRKDGGIKSTFWTLAIISFASFMFLTNMHERYLYPLFAPLTILLLLGEVKIPIYFIASFVNFVNLYTLWWFPRFEPLVLIISYRDYVLPRVLALLLFFAFVSLYLRFLRLFKALYIYF